MWEQAKGESQMFKRCNRLTIPWQLSLFPSLNILFEMSKSKAPTLMTCSLVLVYSNLKRCMIDGMHAFGYTLSPASFLPPATAPEGVATASLNGPMRGLPFTILEKVQGPSQTKTSLSFVVDQQGLKFTRSGCLYMG